LGQSYMPAQEFQILANPNDTGPWYNLTEAHSISTPEWSFTKADLKRFSDN